jgi:hypothetical protein
VAARKSITAWSHFSMGSSSETFTCRHLPTLHPIAFTTSFQRVFCRSFHRLQWRKRCSRVWAVLLPPPHYQHLSSARCPNCFRYVPTGACPDISRWNLAGRGFTLFIGMGLLLPALPYSL